MRPNGKGILRRGAVVGTVVGALSVALGAAGAALRAHWPTVSFAAIAAAFVLAIWAFGLVLDKEE